MKSWKQLLVGASMAMSASAFAGSATVQSTISGSVVAAGSLSAANVDVGTHSIPEFASLIFDLAVTIDLTTGAPGTLYAGTPGTPFALNNGNSFNVAGGAGTVWATIYQPDNVTVLSPMAGMSITGTGSPDTKHLGLKIQPQGNYIGAINGSATLTMNY